MVDPGKATVIAAGLTALAGVVATVITVSAAGDDPDPPEAASPASASSTFSGAESSPSEAPASSKRDRASSAQLALDAAVTAEPCAGPGDTGSAWEVKPATVYGDQMSQAFTCEMSSDAAEGAMEFVVPPGSSRLTAIVGVDDSSQNRLVELRFTVADATGGVLYRQRIGYGARGYVDASVAGIERIILHVEVADYEQDPREASAVAVWGEAAIK
jgi:hypothetical protein